jgi:hypothetical protein
MTSNGKYTVGIIPSTPVERQAFKNLTREERNAKRKEEMQAFRNLTPEERNAKHKEERQSRRNERIAMRNLTPEERKIKRDELFADIKAILKRNKTKEDNISEE